MLFQFGVGDNWRWFILFGGLQRPGFEAKGVLDIATYPT